MGVWMITLLTSFWLGVLTSISPCPLATNIAAMSFLGQQIEKPSRALRASLFYILGRTVTYVTLAILLTQSLLSAPTISQWLQVHMNKLLGPILIIVAMFLIELLQIRSLPGTGKLNELGQKLGQRGGSLGALFLGVVFALSFCPVSAAIFFGSLIPLMLNTQSIVAAPLLYGIGTAAPVATFGLILAFSAGSIGKAFENVKTLERWARRITGILFLGIGIWFTLAYTLELF